MERIQELINNATCLSDLPRVSGIELGNGRAIFLSNSFQYSTNIQNHWSIAAIEAVNLLIKKQGVKILFALDSRTIESFLRDQNHIPILEGEDFNQLSAMVDQLLSTYLQSHSSHFSVLPNSLDLFSSQRFLMELMAELPFEVSFLNHEWLILNPKVAISETKAQIIKDWISQYFGQTLKFVA